MRIEDGTTLDFFFEQTVTHDDTYQFTLDVHIMQSVWSVLLIDFCVTMQAGGHLINLHYTWAKCTGDQDDIMCQTCCT